MTDNDRPQDVARPHTRRASPAPETLELLGRYREVMRAELEDLLAEVRPGLEQTAAFGAPAPIRPALADRIKLWDLAIKLGRELGGAIEEAPPPASSSPTPAGRRAARAPRLSARERRALGE